MSSLRLLLLTALAAGAPLVAAEKGEGPRSVAELEHRLRLIDLELGELAETSLNGGVGAIGYRSKDFEEPDHTTWVQVDLGEEGPIEEVVLVPAILRSADGGFMADAFPQAFRVLVGVDEDEDGEVVAEFSDTRHLLPRLAPLVIATSGARGSWVRVEATRLSRRAFDGRHIFQLSEMLVFDGEVNRALRRPVETSSGHGLVAAWGAGFLVDGILPYVMNAAEGEQSLAFVSRVGVGDQPSITIDLGEEVTVDGLRLHAIDQSDTVPQSFSGDFGLPRHFLVEGSAEPEFEDPEVLLEAAFGSIREVGPVMEWSLPRAACRYLRLTALDPFVFVITEEHQGTVIGFAEIEVLSEGRNVAVGKQPAADLGSAHPKRSLEALTDGRNFYGNILPLRRWLGELARRHDLEAERPRVEKELSRLYTTQRAELRQLAWVVGWLVVAIAAVILCSRFIQIRQEARIRERIAANLHDNLGANLYAIGLLGDLAKDSVDSREELIDTVERIRSLTERTGSAARDCANMLEAHSVSEDLPAQMERDSDSLLADLDHEFVCEGGDHLQRLSRRKRNDLYLFYKEALANILQHSGATRVSTRLAAGAGAIVLSVSDNGQGFTGEQPSSLRRRARLMGADLKLDQPEEGGTSVTLKLKTRKFRFPR